jgi:hypothetical protein
MSKDDPFPNLEDLTLTPEMLARLQKGGQNVNPFRPGALRLKYYLEKVECEHCGTQIYGDQKAVYVLDRFGEIDSREEAERLLAQFGTVEEAIPQINRVCAGCNHTLGRE